MSGSEFGDAQFPEDDIESPRRVKRRRLCDSQERESEGSFSSQNFDASRSSPHSDSEVLKKNGEQSDEQSAAEKKKSKYRIHIPKNPSLPQDAFFTQVPRRSPSPYRIGDFHWQKPRSETTLPISKAQQPERHRQNESNSAFSSLPKATAHEGMLPKTEDDGQKSNEEDEFSDNIFDDVEADAVPETILINSQSESSTQPAQVARVKAPLTNLRQTTLFGTQAPQNGTQNSSRKHNWPLASRDEPPTHHRLDQEALKTWIYPTNLGTIRQYQFNITAKGLYHNMLVALPTGLGKTFIAATIMLNWYRWAPDAQIVFVAPTKPLVSQQVKACFEIAGIPRSDTSLLTGATSPGLRAEEWQSKRVFFMTPQTIVNDLKSGIADPKKIVLLVVDEAHRATGSYAYVEVVKFLKRFNSSFRVLALTATPGSSIETVQEVIDGLGISRVEIRTEESLDIRQYVHTRRIETVLFDNSEEMVMIMDLFSKALQPLVDILRGQNAYWSKDPMALTPYGCMLGRQQWMSSNAGRKASQGIKGMVVKIFSVLASLSHGIELLKFHGIGPFYHKVLTFRNALSGGTKGGKYEKMINDSTSFQTMMSRMQLWINSRTFVGHPKLEYLQGVVLQHFTDAGEGRGVSDPSSTRIMVFSHYRDSAEDIGRILQRNSPMIRPHVFVGQATSGGSDGMDQKTQLDVLSKFKNGTFNTLVATSIGEEGLDIGEVDLIICYDASASPIRMLQRMGRTGRKRTGNIVVTLMRGKEESNFVKAKDNYEKMQHEIASGARFIFHDEESRRIVPKGIQPAEDKRVIDIPLENTQAELPEPKKKGKTPKRPPKKFHMPDGVQTGFVRASRIDGASSDGDDSGRDKGERQYHRKRPSEMPVEVPSLDEVILTANEQQVFERQYLDVGGDEPQIVDIPRLDVFPQLQTIERPTKHVPHGSIGLRAIKAFKEMRKAAGEPYNKYEKHLTREDRDIATEQNQKRLRFLGAPDCRVMQTQSSNIDAETFSLDHSAGHERMGKAKIDPSSGLQNSSTSHNTDTEGDEAESQGSSSRSSPPIIATDLEIPSLPESDEELPDLAFLLGKNEVAKNSGLKNGRRQTRKIVCEDSEDE